MIKGTFWIEKSPDGKTSIGVEDYDVEVFGGMDHEMICMLDEKNLELLTKILSETHDGTLKEMIEEEFGIHLDKKSLSLWMDSKGIEYEYFTWTS